MSRFTEWSRNFYRTYKPYIFMCLRLLLAGIRLYWVCRNVRFEELEKLSLRAVIFGFFGGLLCILIQIFLISLRWRMLLRGQGIEISVFRAASLTFQGQMCSLFLPLGAVGGDVLKAAFLTRETDPSKRVEGIATILLDRLIGMMGLFLLVFVCGACLLPDILHFTPVLRNLILPLLLACAAGFLAGVVILYQDLIFRIRIFAKLLEKADHFARGALSRILNSVEVCRKDRTRLFTAFLLSFLLLHPLLIFAGVLVIYGISGEFPDLISSYFSLGMGNVVSTLPATPGGLGTRDKCIESLLSAFGTSDTHAALIPIIYSLGMICAALGGIFFYFRDSFAKKKE